MTLNIIKFDERERERENSVNLSTLASCRFGEFLLYNGRRFNSNALQNKEILLDLRCFLFVF